MVMEEIVYQREATPNQKWTNRAFQLQQEGKLVATLRIGESAEVFVQGLCPRCNKTFQTVISREITAVDHQHLGVGESTVGASPRYERQAVVCSASPAKGAPSDAMGCGACFSVFAKVQETR
ncbi:hypothetical protein [Tessaracoccus sp. OH4464_COT-324]|uniref:hypothetical protein n=1 Tax=Tessaracoccus sp. OH4464_COT-324 TaxID=2491059 RepID=UPI000F63A6DA|nr:hypothetical protein [Tessaracoccus sp. OH4464_COT-324]RRD45940.1 hypothetical protein EII42_09430 [Tessaracoccus sp. OH4464_COT-324]